MPATPMYLPRLGALFMSFAFGVIGGSVGLNALIKRNQTQSRLFREIPPGPEIAVDTTNVFDSGTVITTVCALIAVISFALLLWTASVRNVSNGRMHSLHSSLHRTLVHQAAVLAFCAVWLFATLIPFEVFFANDSVGISGTLFGLPIPQNTINQIASSLGFHIKYRDYNFLRLVAILPWFTFLFASIAAVVLFMASRRWSTMQGQSTLTDKSVHA